MPANQRAANLFDGRRAHAFGTKGPIVTRGTVPTRTKPYQRQLITRRRSSCKYRARSNATHRLAELVKCNVIGIVSSNCCTIPIRMEINSGSRIVLSTNSKGPFAVTYVIDTVGSGQNERFVNQRPRTIVQFRVRVTNRPDRRKVAGLRPIDDPTEKLIRLLPIFGNILAHTVITGKSVLASIFVVLIYRDQQFANIRLGRGSIFRILIRRDQQFAAYIADYLVDPVLIGIHACVVGIVANCRIFLGPA